MAPQAAGTLEQQIAAQLDRKVFDEDRGTMVDPAFTVTALRIELGLRPAFHDTIQHILTELKRAGQVVTRLDRSGAVLYKRADAHHASWAALR